MRQQPQHQGHDVAKRHAAGLGRPPSDEVGGAGGEERRGPDPAPAAGQGGEQQFRGDAGRYPQHGEAGGGEGERGAGRIGHTSAVTRTTLVPSHSTMARLPSAMVMPAPLAPMMRTPKPPVTLANTL